MSDANVAYDLEELKKRINDAVATNTFEVCLETVLWRLEGDLSVPPEITFIFSSDDDGKRITRWEINSNSNIKFEGNRDRSAKIVVNPNKSQEDLIRISGSNVVVDGVYIQGFRDQNVGGEWGHGFNIVGDHVTLKNSVIKDCHGDGIYIDSTGKVEIHNTICSTNRRNGCSVISGDDILIDGCQFNRTQGTAPEAGVDVEPNAGREVKKLRIINSSASYNARYGFIVTQNRGRTWDISLENCSVEGGKFGLTVRNLREDDGPIEFEKCSVTHTEMTGVLIWDSSARVNVDTLAINRCVTRYVEGESGPEFRRCGFGAYRSSNVKARNVTLQGIEISDGFGIALMSSEKITVDYTPWDERSKLIHYPEPKKDDQIEIRSSSFIERVFLVKTHYADELAIYRNRSFSNLNATENIWVDLRSTGSFADGSTMEFVVDSPNDYRLFVYAKKGSDETYWADQLGSRLLLKLVNGEWIEIDRSGNF